MSTARGKCRVPSFCRSATAFEPAYARCRGTLDLQPSLAWPRTIRTRAVFADDALEAELAGVGKGLGAVAEMLVELDADLCATQEPVQCALTLEQRARSQILAIELEQIERPKECYAIQCAAMQALEIRDAGVVADHHLAVDRGVGGQRVACCRGG